MNGFFAAFARFSVLYLLRPVVLLCGALVSSVYNVLLLGGSMVGNQRDSAAA